MQYLVFQTFEGFSVFTGRYQECRSRKRVLRTDENGEFKARNIRPGALATIAIFGTTSANEKIIPLAETMEIEGTGPHVREFRVERGCTIRCTLVLPEGEWSPEIRSEVDWGLVIPGRGKQLAYRYMQPASAEGEIVIGPFLESGQATLPVAVIRFNEARDRFIGRGEIPEMKKGVNHVVVELERPRVPEKPAGSVTVIAVRESGTILGIGAMREDVTGVVRDSRGKYMRTNVQGHSLQEFPCDSDGRIDLPISGYGPYTVGVLIGCAYHEIDRLHLAPGDELRFLFPEEKLLGLGSIEVSFTDEEGLPYAVLQASLWPAASDYPLMRQEMKSSMSFSHLRGGRYELKVFTRPRIVATPPACVDVKPREPVRVSIRVSPSTAVWGRFVGWTQPIADTPVFLSGVTRAGEVFQETALSDREGKFGFRAVPSGEFTCVASCAEGVLGPVNLSLDDLGKAPEIEMALDASRSSVEFRVRGAEGGQPGSLRFVEVLTDPGGKRVWLHPPDLQ